MDIWPLYYPWSLINTNSYLFGLLPAALSKSVQYCNTLRIILYILVKGFVSVITSEPPISNGNVRFRTIPHAGLTRVSSIRFLLFEIKRILVFNSIIIYFTDLFILYVFIQNAYAGKKKYFRKKAKKLCLMGQIVMENLKNRQNREIYICERLYCIELCQMVW